jgi:hypothetical protein
VALTPVDLSEIEKSVAKIDIQGERLPPAVLRFSNR